MTIVELVFVAFLVSTVSAQEPEIVEEIWAEVKPIGRTARLNCTVANKEPHMVVWTHLGASQEGTRDEVISQDETISPSINPSMGGLKKYEIQVRKNENRVTYMLIIRRLRQQNAGIYECKVQITGVAHTSWPKKLGILTVQVAPTIRPGDTDALLQIEQGANATLTCVATGIPAPNITWTKSDGGSLPVPDGRAKSRGSVLNITEVTIDNAGVYRCVADNNIKPPAEHLAELVVFQEPKARVVYDTVGQALGGRYEAILECIVKGHPPPTVRWTRLVNGVQVPVTDFDNYVISKQTTDTQNLYAQEEWYTLKVKNVIASDFTTYYCISSNKYGEFSIKIELYETTECQGANCPSFAAESGVNGGDDVKPSHVLVTLVALLFSAKAAFP